MNGDAGGGMLWMELVERQNNDETLARRASTLDRRYM
jgi:hypothetical protein